MALGFDDGYFQWLCRHVEGGRNLDPRRTHQLLLSQLHQTPFEIHVTKDRNRAGDGKELRRGFLHGYDVDASWEAADCSVLEMLIALSRHAAFQSYGEPDDWFWHMLDNIGIAGFADDGFGEWTSIEVSQRLAICLQRQYGSDGNGSFFPLRFSNQDQRHAELWYQMAAYIMEGSGPRV